MTTEAKKRGGRPPTPGLAEALTEYLAGATASSLEKKYGIPRATIDGAARRRYQKETTGRTSLPEKSKRYEKTASGFLMRAYRNMKSRVTGVQHKKHHLYAGKELLSKEEFYAWAKPHPQFRRLFELWEASGYDQRLTPSVNRIDATVGYRLDNMEWITHSQNSALTSRTLGKGKPGLRAIYAAVGLESAYA